MDSLVQKMLDESEREKGLWWVIFLDTSPNGSGFLGATVVEGHGHQTAVFNAHQKGVNPGGDPIVLPIPAFVSIPDDSRDRLLNAEEYKLLSSHVSNQMYGLKPRAVV